MDWIWTLIMDTEWTLTLDDGLWLCLWTLIMDMIWFVSLHYLVLFFVFYVCCICSIYFGTILRQFCLLFV